MQNNTLQIKLSFIGVSLAKSPKSKKSRVESFGKTVDMKKILNALSLFSCLCAYFVCLFFLFAPFL